MSSNYQRGEEARTTDLHLLLSEKYMAYKDLAERCVLQIKPGDQSNDYRCFYMQPDSVFLQEPRVQNQFRNGFVRAVGQPPSSEPLTLFADDLHKAYNSDVQDKSNPDFVKDELCNFFKRRQYKLQHKRYKMQLRWAHTCLTSADHDRTSIKLNPLYAKTQFELENAVKRHQRLTGNDHFLTSERPRQEEGSSYADEGVRPPLSALRSDDIEVYWRIVTYEEKITRKAERLIQRAKWLPFSHRFEIYEDAVDYFQELRVKSVNKQKEYIKKIEQKGSLLIDLKKLGDTASNELLQIVNSKHVYKLEKKIQSTKDVYTSKSKYNYEMPPMVFWNEIDLKLQLQELADHFKIYGDMESDNGHSFSYSVMVSFPQHFQYQAVMNQFAPYDAVPKMIDPANLAKKNIKKVLQRNQKKYGRTQGANTLLEKIEIEKHQKEMGIEFLNSVEKALFGEFNNAQVPDFPSVRVKKADWVELVPFKPKLDNDQMYQASILSCEKNWIDEVLANMLETLNVQDVQSVNLIMESLSQLHCDKVKFGQVKTDFLNFDPNDVDTFFTEDQKSFISLLKGCFKAKMDFDSSKPGAEIPADSLHEIPQHLLFANYLLQVLSARDHKTKLLYTLNQFRAIQRRLTIELREMGTRDRVLGDAQLVMPMEQRSENNVATTDDDDESSEVTTPVSQVGVKSGSGDLENADVLNDPLVDLNKYRFNKRAQNFLHTTCPIVPKFHSTFGEPIERQEISQDIDNGRNTDGARVENRKLVGRVDQLYKHEKTGLNLVKDDFGVHILYDSAFADMRTMESELLKVCSYYINKAEPLLDNDLRNMYPVVDRLKILDEVLDCEQRFQEAKSHLVMAYLECFEHASDVLEQQRLVQAMVDEMAKRPRLNLSGTHFKDSYHAEIESLELKTKLVRELMAMLMDAEKRANQNSREYLEKAYRLLYEQLRDEWHYLAPEDKEDELNQREVLNKKEGGARLAKNDKLVDKSERKKTVDELELLTRREAAMNKLVNRQSGRFTNLTEFASYFQIPVENLKQMMEQHHERDHLVRQSIHEQVAFIKMSEGYPQHLSHNSSQQDGFKYTEKSESIGVLDFYESLQTMPRVCASIERAIRDIQDVHRPDNGLTATALEIATLNYLIAELKLVKDGETGVFDRPAGMEHLSDDSIVGNADKMLFYTKELAACAHDPRQAQNPFVVGKLDVDQVQKFDFLPFMGYIESVPISSQKEAELPANIDSQPVQNKNFGQFYPKLKERTADLKLPSMLTLMCNSVEILRLRNTLLNTIEQSRILEDVYAQQAKLLGIECKINFKEQMNVEHFVTNGPENFVNFIEAGPAADLDINLAINEFDAALRSCICFSDPEAFKALILPLGLEELRAVVAYEVMNLQILIVGVRTNQIQMDNTQRKLCEVGFFQRGFVVANPVLDVLSRLSGPNMIESKLQKLPGLVKSEASSYLTTNVSKGYYNIIARKSNMKEAVEKTFKNVKNSLLSIKDQKIEVTAKKLRALKIVMCHDYCKDVLARVYCDAVRLQILSEVDNLRRRIYMLPKESIFLELSVPRQGEYQSAAYREEAADAAKSSNPNHKPLTDKSPVPAFFNQDENKVQSFWRLPTNTEILDLYLHMDKFKELNIPRSFDYDFGNANEDKLTEFAGNNQLELIQQRLPRITLTDSIDVDQVVKDRSRLVEFEEAYDYNSVSNVVKFLRYWKQVSNIFDLEFFINKLASSAFAISNVEKMVLSGVPFYDDDGDEQNVVSEIDDEDSNEDEEGNAALQRSKTVLNATAKRSTKNSEVNKFDDAGHNPLKNVLAGLVAEKLAQEKREKIQLVTDLESIKDKFVAYEGIMKKQEMQSSLARAETFLSEVHSVVFYGILFILYQMQDNYFKEKKGQKEIQAINEVIQNLSHQTDLKVTYLNGFHVNVAITALERVNVDQNVYRQDYDNFFKATQPLIDEEALNPTEFNLVKGIYLTNSINMMTFKKNVPFMGHLVVHDYRCLDFALTNLSKEIRKYISTNLGSIEMTLQAFITAKMKINEKEYASNPSVYSQLMTEKKNYLKQQIKARQLRRIYMMISNRKMIPLDIEEYNAMHQHYIDDMQWKLVHHMDQISNSRSAAHQRDVASQKKKSASGQIQQAMKAPKEDSALKAFDQAASEIQVVQSELQKYMIQVSFEMFKKETDALAKVFEMTTLRVAAFIHPAQQFASSFHSTIDKRNHLDIINKVGPIQKLLTQIKNRCLEIETLTSGTGIVISSKDLNECLEECCRSLIKYGEIEMRTRCEYLSMNLVQYENLLYIKDMQLLNLEGKLKSAKTELNKIVNTKVFSRGNNLIYELDMTNRQMRLLKDNIFLLEKRLTEKIKLCYDRELDQTRMQLADIRHQFQEFSQSVSAKVKAGVREETNQIDGIMKAKAAMYKDLTQQTARQDAFVKYKEKFGRDGQVNNNTTVNIDQLIINKDGSVTKPGGVDPKLQEQLETLKQNEQEAREEVLRLMDVIRKYRLMNKFKEVLTNERNQFKIDNLKQQLTSNTTLWEQLAESEKREKILKQEIERAQQEIATQEKIIERLKDDIKKEGREKQKLLQYKNTKSKRLDELEAKAREFEVLSSVNLNKILGLLENKEDRINHLSRAEANMNETVQAIHRMNEKEVHSVRRRAQEETRFKIEAMTKLEGLRQELQTMQGSEAPVQSVGFWKEQCQSLFDVCKNLKEDNEKLVEHLGVGHPNQNAISQAENELHPLDQFNNNADLLNYLNQQHAQGQSGPKPQHQRHRSQQATNLQPQNTHELMYGMSQGLADHMLGLNKVNRNQMAAGSSMNSFSSEQRDHFSSGAHAGFALPRIGARNLGQSHVSESIVMGGNVAQTKFNPAQPALNDSFNSLGFGKLAPVYKRNGLFGPGGHNVFHTLNAEGYAGVGAHPHPHAAAGHQDSKHMPNQTSIDRTTNITGGNLSTFRGSPVPHPNHSYSIADPNQSADLGTGNIFNFAPQTQRAMHLAEGRIGDTQQDSLNLPFESSRIEAGSSGQRNPVNEFGEFIGGGETQLQGEEMNSLPASAQRVAEPHKAGKKGEARLVTQLQPKLINPPAKLTMTLGGKNAKAQFIKRGNPQK